MTTSQSRWLVPVACAGLVVAALAASSLAPARGAAPAGSAEAGQASDGPSVPADPTGATGPGFPARSIPSTVGTLPTPTTIASLSTLPPPSDSPPPGPVQTTTTLATTPTTPAPALVAPNHDVAWGVYVPGAPGDMAEIAAIGRSVGKAPAIVMWYSHWVGPYSAYASTGEGIDHVAAIGALSMVTWMSSDPSVADDAGAEADPTFTDAAIAAGSQDVLLRHFADGIRTSKQVVFLRLDQEMNGGWYPWDAGVDGNTAQDFVAMWRHVHDVFSDEGATNVRWVWSPNVECGGCTAYRQLYPGDAYVDWIGLDGYNYAASNGGSWMSFDQVYRQSYIDLLAVSDKPMMITELGTVEGTSAAESKAAWITDALHSIVAAYPAVQAFVWFNQDNGDGQDFRFDSTPASLAAFRAALAAPSFTSTLHH